MRMVGLYTGAAGRSRGWSQLPQRWVRSLSLRLLQPMGNIPSEEGEENDITQIKEGLWRSVTDSLALGHIAAVQDRVRGQSPSRPSSVNLLVLTSHSSGWNLPFKPHRVPGQSTLPYSYYKPRPYLIKSSSVPFFRAT